jgi:hypothetical protein
VTVTVIVKDPLRATMVQLKAFQAILLVLLSALSVADGKVKRVKAGQHYKDHDAVHVVVNKVG